MGAAVGAYCVTLSFTMVHTTWKTHREIVVLCGEMCMHLLNATTMGGVEWMAGMGFVLYADSHAIVEQQHTLCLLG